MREGEELKAPRHASAAATRDGNLPSRDGSLLYVTATCLIPNSIGLSSIYKRYLIYKSYIKKWEYIIYREIIAT